MELLIVIVILGLLAGLVMPALLGKADKAKQDLACIAMGNIKQALDTFKLDNGTYPDQEKGLMALIKNPDPERFTNYDENGYFEHAQVPKDPWRNEYIYIHSDDGIDIITLGADGKEGGSKENKDLSYVKCIQKQ